MGKKRRQFTKEFKEDAVRLVTRGGRSINEAAESVGVHRTLLSGWIKQSEIDQAGGSPNEMTTAEKEELVRLRRENKQLKMETEFLKKTAAYFAKDSSKGSS
jgi:transposase